MDDTIYVVKAENDVKNAVQITPRNVVALADAHELVELANAIQSARDFVKAQAVGKLEVIAEQMEFLRKQAIEVLRKAQQDNELHSVECKVKKVPSKVYFLYRQCSGGEALRRFFSLISPEEWGGERALERRAMQFLGAYRLEFNQTWSKQDANEAPNSNKKMQILGQIDKFLDFFQFLPCRPMYHHNTDGTLLVK